MADELPDVPALRVLEPPPGGLQALRDRLDVRPSRWWLVAVPALVVAALVLVFLRRETPLPIAAATTALPDREVGTTFYWVASTPGITAAPPAPRVEVATTISIADAPQVTTQPLP